MHSSEKARQTKRMESKCCSSKLSFPLIGTIVEVSGGQRFVRFTSKR